MNTQQFLRTLALTESSDRGTMYSGTRNRFGLLLGDNGRALGTYQVHPDWVFTYSKKYKIEPKLNEEWETFIERIVEAFFNDNQNLNPVEIAMYFHLGHRSAPESSDWDKNYADRFNQNSTTGL